MSLVLYEAGHELAKTDIAPSNGSGQIAAVHTRPLPQNTFRTTLILNTPSIRQVPNIQASSSRFCPIGCAHRLVHHRHSAWDIVSGHRRKGMSNLPSSSKPEASSSLSES